MGLERSFIIVQRKELANCGNVVIICVKLSVMEKKEHIYMTD